MGLLPAWQSHLTDPIAPSKRYIPPLFQPSLGSGLTLELSFLANPVVFDASGAAGGAGPPTAGQVIPHH